CVFKALSMSGDLLAIKVLGPDNLLRIRSDREIAKLRLLSSPHIAKLVDFGDVELRGQNCRFMVTEFIEGQDLRRVLEARTRLPEANIVSLLSTFALPSTSCGVFVSFTVT
ncbi:MAG: hypothetical protein Q8P50_16340, partial [Bacillota bacterium]|nr:hypothetical protein [Bacillota bacterium]